MPVTKMPFAIEVDTVTYKYGSNIVLDQLSCKIKDGSYVGIIGPNGGGKTTLLKLMLGLVKPTTGNIKVYNQPVDQLTEKYTIGYVPQRISQEHLQFPATVYEIVASGITPKLKLFAKMDENDRKQIKRALMTADIWKQRDTLIGELSGGQRQRAFVARALAGNPRLLLLDEPFTGVDIASQRQFYELLKKLNKDHGLTIIFVSHDLDVISQEVTELLCLNKRLVCQGSPDSIIENNIIENLYGKKITHLRESSGFYGGRSNKRSGASDRHVFGSSPLLSNRRHSIACLAYWCGLCPYARCSSYIWRVNCVGSSRDRYGKTA